MKKLYTLTLLCLVVLASCKTKPDNTSELESSPSTIEESTSTKVSFDGAEIVLSNAQGDKIGGFTSNPITIYAGSKKYISKTKPDKHKFYTNGDLTYEVKFKSEGFKLRDKNSDLLWKIKIYADKIKVSDNEENVNAFEIKKYEEKIKIKRNNEELYTIQLKDSSIIANDKVVYTLSSNQMSYAYAVMAISEIPEDQKLFILAELLAKI